MNREKSPHEDLIANKTTKPGTTEEPVDTDGKRVPPVPPEQE